MQGAKALSSGNPDEKIIQGVRDEDKVLLYRTCLYRNSVNDYYTSEIIERTCDMIGPANEKVFQRKIVSFAPAAQGENI